MDDGRRLSDPSSPPDHSVPDLWELAVARAAEDPGGQDGGGEPPLPRLRVGPFRIGPTGLLLGVALLVGVGTLVRFGGGDRTPDLATSCTTPALALSVERARPGGLVDYALTGADGEVTLAVVPRRDDGTSGPPVQRLPVVRLVDCRATGRFGLQAPSGEYAVVVTRGGSEVARVDVTVTDPRDPVVG